MLKKVEFGTKNKTNAVFLALHLKSKRYEGYHNVPESIQMTEFGQFMLLHRWDGSFGFVGGMVDDGEDFITALQREALEEINFEIKNTSELKEVCTHQNGDINLHLYSLEIDLDTKFHILKNAHLASDYEAEVNGIVFPQVFSCSNKNKPSIERFLEKSLFAPAVKEEIIELIEKESLNIYSC